MNVRLRCGIVLAIATAVLLSPWITIAGDEDPGKTPWEKFGANIGVFFSAVDSTLRIGTGIGVDVDVEKALGLDSSTFVFRADALWRFTKNRRHRLDFTWFSLNRDGDRRVLDDITIEHDGETITIPSGTTVESFFDLDIYEVAYSYSFFQDERIDLAAGIGLYVMPIDFGIKATGIVDDEGSERFTAPLPVFGLRMDVALTPQWFIRAGGQVFYVEYDTFAGSVLEFKAALEYNPWKQVGIGVGFDTLNLRMEAEGEDWPGINFDGKINFNYTGLQLYLKVFY